MNSCKATWPISCNLNELVSPQGKLDVLSTLALVSCMLFQELKLKSFMIVDFLMTSWDIHQQTFALSLASNALQDRKAPLASLQAAIEQLVPSYIQKGADQGLKGWDVVWGPTVWKHPMPPKKDPITGPDNTWYIANNPTSVFPDGTFNTYVVAIAGTASTYGWWDEDFRVNYVVDFLEFAKNIASPPKPAARPINDAKNTYVALGTAGGVFALLSTKAPTSAKNPGKTVVDFLSSIPPQSRVIFTGHSLGGALSPTLALILQVSKGLQNVYTYPTAGPTPGNGNFVKLFTSKNPSQSTGPHIWQAWNGNLYNKLDVVPQAWSTEQKADQTLHNVPGLWGKLPFWLGEKVGFIVGLGIKIANASKIKYVPLPGLAFSSDPPPIPKKWAQWRATVSEEHVDAYLAELGVEIPVSFSFELFEKHGLMAKTPEEYVETFPFLELLKILELEDADEEKDENDGLQSSYTALESGL